MNCLLTGLFLHIRTDWQTCLQTRTTDYLLMCLNSAEWLKNSVDPDQTPRTVASELGLHVCLRPAFVSEFRTTVNSILNPCPAEPGYTLPLQTVQIQISWLLKKQIDLNLHCLPCHSVYELMSTILIKVSDWLTFRCRCGILIYSAWQGLILVESVNHV